MSGPVVAQAAESAAQARLHLYGDWYLADPWFLLAIPAALTLVLYGRGRRGIEAGRVPVARRALAKRLPRTLRQRLLWAAPALQAAALSTVAVALARPVRANVLQTTTSEGVDIALVIDRSSSMKFHDLDPERSRLAVVKEVVGDFALRRMTDEIGAADSVALLSFAQYPQLLCPFTLDAGALLGFLEEVDIVRNELEDGTAIGRGLAKAVELLAGTDARSKVVVLLTDGENNVDDITPLRAAELAEAEGVRVYAVLAGRFVYQEDVFGRVHATQREIDSSELEAIAERTGGRFFRARDRASLERTYEEIEALERTERREERYTLTRDVYPRLVLAGLFLYLFGWISAATWARRLP